MAKRIGVLEADQAQSEKPRFFEKKSIVQHWVRRAEARWIVKGRIVQKLKTRARAITEEIRGFFDGPLGVGNLLPFSRSRNPLLPPGSLHYEVPHAGDRGLFARHRRKRIRVSGRNLFAQQKLAC